MDPVIPEMVNQVAFSVVGNDVTVTIAAEAGQLQLNAFEPVIAHSLLESIAWMTAAFQRLATQCIDGIEVDLDHLESVTGRSVGVVTALTPYCGYAAAAHIVKGRPGRRRQHPRPGAGHRPSRRRPPRGSPPSRTVGRHHHCPTAIAVQERPLSLRCH